MYVMYLDVTSSSFDVMTTNAINANYNRQFITLITSDCLVSVFHV